MACIIFGTTAEAQTIYGGTSAHLSNQWIRQGQTRHSTCSPCNYLDFSKLCYWIQVVDFRVNHKNALTFKRHVAMGALNLDMTLEASYGRHQSKVGVVVESLGDDTETLCLVSFISIVAFTHMLGNAEDVLVLQMWNSGRQMV